MSWISNIAGRAEELLNKVDQTAAQALHTEGEGETASQPAPGVQRSHHVETARYERPGPPEPPRMETQALHTSASMVSLSSPRTASGMPRVPSLGTISQGSPQRAYGRKKPKDEDEKLFEFLNSPNTFPAAEKKKDVTKAAEPSSTIGKHSRQSSDSSSVSAYTEGSTSYSSMAVEAKENVMPTPSVQQTGSGEMSQTVTDISEPPSSEPTTNGSSDGSDGVPTSSESSDDQPLRQQVSSLTLENNLLRSEVASLNQEMTSLIQRCKTAQEEVTRTKQRLDTMSSGASQTDRIIRELRSREEDLTEAITTKDAQLAVLKVRLDEADQELKAKRTMVDELQSEKDRILRDHSDSSGIHSQALDSLREKLHEAEAALKREQESYKIAQNEAMERQHKLEGERHSMAESLTSAQKQVQDDKKRITDLTVHMEKAKATAESARQELSDYKQKATRILQSKEKLINSLRQGSDGDAGAAGLGASVGLELEELRHERDLQREDIQHLSMQLDQARLELQEQESQLQSEIDMSRDQIRELEDHLSQEKQLREDSETELASLKQEMRYIQEEMVKQKTTFQTRLKDREEEIQKLRNQMTTKAMSTTTQSELEGRLHSLTESLIQKQTMLEALSTEKNSLVLQLERLEQQYRAAQPLAGKHPGHTVVGGMEEEDGARVRSAPFLHVDPSSSGTSPINRVKRAANSIDKFSIRLGVFLRRYPTARLFVILYMVLLHLWVMIVLLTYTPEIHTGDQFHSDLKQPHPDQP
ncbi:GOLGA5 [Branchiostoma lanceolatum]|uniref:Golgin subfamily A member 5 n=1 Tax=Branchiostoma lanceolatum TaxID=7740 RepID=A0A8J9ZT99_BRALA|nr:GOLGA5 [Branchiostoma lanceolatum]